MAARMDKAARSERLQPLDNRSAVGITDSMAERQRESRIGPGRYGLPTLCRCFGNLRKIKKEAGCRIADLIVRNHALRCLGHRSEFEP